MSQGINKCAQWILKIYFWGFVGSFAALIAALIFCLIQGTGNALQNAVVFEKCMLPMVVFFILMLGLLEIGSKVRNPQEPIHIVAKLTCGFAHVVAITLVVVYYKDVFPGYFIAVAMLTMVFAGVLTMAGNCLAIFLENKAAKAGCRL